MARLAKVLADPTAKTEEKEEVSAETATLPNLHFIYTSDHGRF